MKNIKMITAFAITILAIADEAFAQDNPFANTTWKIVSNEEGRIELTKARKINLPTEQPKFHYIQFEAKGYASGTHCFQTDGQYTIQGHNQIQFSEGAAGMTSDCEEPKSIDGSYYFEMENGTMVLQKNEESTEEPMEEAYEISVEKEAAENAAAAIEAAEEAARDIEIAQPPKKKK